MEYSILLEIAIIILLVNIFSIILNKLHLPRVVGGILVGIILGPSVFNVITSFEFLDTLAQLGIISIMLIAGLSTNFKKFLDKTNKYFIISLFTTIIPLVIGFIINKFFILEHSFKFFFTILITCSSASIAIEELIELGKIDSKLGRTILGVSVINTMFSILLISIYFDPNSYSFAEIVHHLLEISLFFIGSAIVGFIVFKVFEKLEEGKKEHKLLPMLSLVIALMFAYFGEKITGVNGVVGAYIAGLIIGNTKRGGLITRKLSDFAYMFFIPIFSVTLGLKLDTIPVDFASWQYIIILVICILAIRIISAILGARVAKYNWKESLNIGIGMGVTGDIALVFILKAKSTGAITNELFSASLIAIIIVSIIIPTLVDFRFSKKKPKKQLEEIKEV